MITTFVLILLRLYFVILVPWTDLGSMCRAKSLKGYLILKWFVANKLAAFGLSFQKLIFFPMELLGVENCIEVSK